MHTLRVIGKRPRVDPKHLRMPVPLPGRIVLLLGLPSLPAFLGIRYPPPLISSPSPSSPCTPSISLSLSLTISQHSSRPEMLCNDEQTMMGILPTTNEWPQSFMVMMPGTTPSTSTSNNSSTTSTPDTAAVPRQTGPLNCPRCNSTNTKFCYYNNYSLTQPRHFCKACKRYWTRGGTLRNVPVGGGCRKNKRVKKSSPSPSPSIITTNPPALSLPQPIISRVDSSTANINPNFFFDLSNNNLSYSNLQQRMQQYAGSGFYDLQPQMNSLGLGFTQNNDHQYAANITESTAVSSAVQEFPYPLFGSSASAASLLVSSLKQPRKLDDFQSLFQYDDHQAGGSHGVIPNHVKVEGQAIGSGTDWNLSYDQTPLDAMASAAVTASATAPTDSSFMYWNSAWPEMTNYGSSIAPLI